MEFRIPIYSVPSAPLMTAVRLCEAHAGQATSNLQDIACTGRGTKPPPMHSNVACRMLILMHLCLQAVVGWVGWGWGTAKAFLGLGWGTIGPRVGPRASTCVGGMG